jgi:hypothetical protein
MKKRLTLALLSLALVLSLASCKCSAEKAAVDRLGDQQEKVFEKYTRYVNADPKLDAKAKDDEQKFLQSIRDIVLALKRSMGD